MFAFDAADESHPLSTAEDIIHAAHITALDRPVIFSITGEDRVPYNVGNALDLLTKGARLGPFTRCALRLGDIQAVLVTDSRLPTDSPVLARYRANYTATLSALLCQYVGKEHCMLGARRLVALRADVNACEGTEGDGGSALHAAVAHNRFSMQEWLLQECQCKVAGVYNRAGTTPFLVAVARDSTESVQRLHAHTWARFTPPNERSEHERMLHDTDADGASALVIAIRRGLSDMIVFLRDVAGSPLDAFDVSLNTTTTTTTTTTTPLQPQQMTMTMSGCLMSLSPIIVAIESDRPTALINSLVQAGANILLARKGKLNALGVAAQLGRLPHLCILLRHGLLPDAEAFRQAAIANRPKILRVLAHPSWRPLTSEAAEAAASTTTTTTTTTTNTTTTNNNNHHNNNNNNNDDDEDDDDESDDDDDDDQGLERDALRLWQNNNNTNTTTNSGGGGGPSHLLRPSQALVAAVEHSSYQAVQTLRDMGVKTTAALLEAVRSDRVWAVRLLLLLPPSSSSAPPADTTTTTTTNGGGGGGGGGAARLPKVWPEWKDTPLTLAVRLQRIEIVHLMVLAADLPPALLNAHRSRSDQRTALDIADENGLVALAHMLRRAGALTSADLVGQRKRRLQMLQERETRACRVVGMAAAATKD